MTTLIGVAQVFELARRYATAWAGTESCKEDADALDWAVRTICDQRDEAVRLVNKLLDEIAGVPKPKASLLLLVEKARKVEWMRTGGADSA